MKRAEGRKFAWTLAVGFAALAGMGYWRHRPRTALVFAVVAAIALLAGAMVPTRLGPAARAWERLGELLSRVTSPLVFTILYYLVLTPMGFVRRTIARSPLARSPAAGTYWVARDPVPPENARRGMEHLF